MTAAPRPRVPTGIEGLDVMLAGGIPEGASVLLRGGPGAGKTTLALQFLAAGAARGEQGLYITLEESPAEVLANGAQFGWDLDTAIGSGLLTIQALQLQRVKDYLKAEENDSNWLVTLEGSGVSAGVSGDFRSGAVTDIIARLVRETRARRVVFDSLTMFTAQFERRVDLHLETLALMRGITEAGCTAIFTAHQDPSGRDVVTPEEYLPQGVLGLHAIRAGGRIIQALEITKMRGVRHDRELRPYRIGDTGFVVYAQETVLVGG